MAYARENRSTFSCSEPACGLPFVPNLRTVIDASVLIFRRAHTLRAADEQTTRKGVHVSSTKYLTSSPPLQLSCALAPDHGCCCLGTPTFSRPYAYTSLVPSDELEIQAELPRLHGGVCDACRHRTISTFFQSTFWRCPARLATTAGHSQTCFPETK